ncbi:flagellar basal-body rod protein FlgG [Poseidonibacter ostreae]|jgi:flagellar basal-body rod protein FlgG|uniref:Flagellar basal-body rod protein FlgG n=1 Tax=Poseidonibacter ostreae TaxID=2654171 RepID=A0A6L4WPQ4_9BACT|nr:flagellar basal-body rod protein FlgG [Poseidonibacter ostreae]KAB7885415.1 flagellar basal-body rod protein FlgG [Poseidonibacter ostreae]KAB7886306.1 flagellar basal-body rod protein FlgG [Poseidonibacter ostreae]KAB7890030.1 flagellar basal-body rod protein FlgG [Poseidonibacter ostreae]
MIRGLYTAATGMNAMQHQIDVTSNNIANVNTSGFKQDRAEFQDLMYETLNYTAGQTTQTTRNPTGIDTGLGVRISGIQKNFSEGDLQLTSNTLDLAIEGNGFFQITLPSGETAYTRNGAFKLNSEGTIVNGNGYELSPQIVVPDNVTDVTFGTDGIVTATNSSTGDSQELGQIELADFINPSGLTPLGESLYMVSEASGDVLTGDPTTDQFGGVRQGMIELSNVKLVTEMVDLITAQRAYEANSKAITTTDSMLDTVNRLKS